MEGCPIWREWNTYVPGRIQNIFNWNNKKLGGFQYLQLVALGVYWKGRTVLKPVYLGRTDKW